MCVDSTTEFFCECCFCIVYAVHVTIKERKAHTKYILVWKCLSLKVLHSVEQDSAYYAQKAAYYSFQKFSKESRITFSYTVFNIPILFLWQVKWLC